MGDKVPLQQFTAIGIMADDEIWQADDGDFKPFRRREHESCAKPGDGRCVD